MWDGLSYEYRIPGGGCISLTDLLTALRIGGEDINSFENGIEDVLFSNPELVWVGRIDEDTTVGAIKEAFGLEALCGGGFSEEQINDQTVEAGDWAVISILPFDSEETLTVAMKNGERFEIRVTDDAGQTVSSSLVDFLTNVTIIAPTNESGQYVIDPGTEYSINMTFQEKPPRPGQTALQFSDSPLIYPIPNGILVDGASGSIDLQITRGNVVYTIHDNTFRVENGVLTFQFNTDDPNYRQLAACNNVCFTISITGFIAESSNVIKFSDSIEKTIVIDDSNSVTTSKSAYVDIQNDKIVYTATVTSSGRSTNVVVTDTISGTALTLDPTNITATSSTGNTVSFSNKTIDGNTFTCTIPSMANGEIITFRYWANINPSLLQMLDGKVITQSGNTFHAKSRDDPPGDTTTVTNTIDYTPTIQKSSGTLSAVNGNKATLDWSIVVNPDAKVSAAGTVVTDTIAPSSQSIMTYSGDGITVTVLDSNGVEVRTYSVGWNDLTSHSSSSWSYTIPEADSGYAYKYVIDYTTEVNIDGQTGQGTVQNNSTTSAGQSSSGVGQIPKDPHTPVLTKDVTQIDRDKKTVSWKVTFTVPEEGLTKAVIRDVYPRAYIDDTIRFVYESVVEDSISVAGLIPGVENYTTNNDTNNKQYYITFTQNGNQGLMGTGSIRTIDVTFKTIINDDWVQKTMTDPDSTHFTRHKNDVYLDVGLDTELHDDATANITDTLNKSVVNNPITGKPYSRTVNGVSLPVYRYEIVFSGIDNDQFTITDTFDTNLLMPYTSNDLENPFRLLGGNIIDNQYIRASVPVSYTNTNTGIIFQVTADSLPKNVNGDYYPFYKLVYYLTVKDENALNTLMLRAAGEEDGIYNITNTVEWNGQTDTCITAYTYQGLDKELLTDESQLNHANIQSGNVDVRFQITLNPAGMVLNGGSPLTMKDTVDQLSVDITSITAVPSSGVSWEMNGNTVTYTIPDQTKVVITYTARVLYPAGDVTGEQSVTFRNTADMKGYHDEIKKVAKVIKASGEGTGIRYYINLMKYEAGDMTHRLEGAVFGLYNSKTNDDVIDETNPVTDKNGKPVTFTTGPDGMILVEGDQEEDQWSITADQRYYLRELQAPDGYMLSDFDYSFQIASDGVANYDEYIYFSGDTMSAKNYPGTDVVVNKEWSDGNEVHNDDTVTVKLQRRMQTGTDPDTWSDWRDTGKELQLNAAGNWTGKFAGLPLVVPDDDSGEDVYVEYRVVETHVNGEPATASNISFEKIGGAFVFTVTNTLYPGIEIIKIDEFTRSSGEGSEPTYLSGAEFKIYKWNGTRYALYPDENSAAVTTDNKGEAFFPGVEPGEYRIVETGIPAGYVMQEVNDIYFKVEYNSETALYEAIWYKEAYDGSNGESRTVLRESDKWKNVTFKQAAASSPAAFTVGNVPGVELPATGSSHAKILSIIGTSSLVLSFAGYMLLRRRKED